MLSTGIFSQNLKDILKNKQTNKVKNGYVLKY